MIYLVITFWGIVSSIFDRAFFGQKCKVVFRAVVYSVIYYCLTVSARAILSNGSDYLSFSFSNKGINAYLKDGLLMFLMYAFINVSCLLISRENSKKINLFDEVLGQFAAIFLLIETTYIVAIGWPNMDTALFIIGISAVVEVFLFIYKNVKHKCIDNDEAISIEEQKETVTLRGYICIAIPLVLYSFIYLLSGPTELMLYNKGDFVFSYATAISKLVVGALYIIIPATIVIPETINNVVCKLYSCVITLFCILSYVQSLILNGKMELVDGGIQNWTNSEYIRNILIWAIIIAFVLYISRKTWGYKLLLGLSVYLIIIQIVTMAYVVIVKDGFHSSERQLTEDGAFVLSEGNNVVVFILDAYDVQMLQHVIDNDPDYLSPLHDFTYYNNMVSRYTATDGSLPYLLTGANINDPIIEKDQSIWYKDSRFLKDLKNSGCDIRILTENKYVEPFEEGIIDNFIEEYYCKTDPEKTLELFSRCMKYKCFPFILKTQYRYEEYDVTNVITDTNVYIFGTDSDFDNRVVETGISVGDISDALRIYHLYGAHSPYYLTEEADLDYNSTPLAQWRGSLKIVYDYIEELRKKNIYDNTTIIIMADHGLNNTQINSVKDAGLNVDEKKTNPIFFVKRDGEKADAIRVDNSPTSHDVFFDTIRESLNLMKNYYGSIWD